MVIILFNIVYKYLHLLVRISLHHLLRQTNFVKSTCSFYDATRRAVKSSCDLPARACVRGETDLPDPCR